MGGARDILCDMSPSAPLAEVAQVFTRLGVTAFGGPAAHVAAMEDELVSRRQWVTRDEFADLVGAANLIPGPNSTELAIHLGYRRAGWRGLLVAGICFIVPAVLMVWGLAWAYGRYGGRVEVQAMLQGLQPAVLAVVVQAIWRLKGSLARTRLGGWLAIAAFIGALLGVSELYLLLGAIAIALTISASGQANGSPEAGMLFPMGALLPSGAAAAASTLSAGGIFLSFAKIGSVLFGSGYVLLSFLRGEFVTRLGVLTEGQLLDAIAVGQVTPGPVFSAATFVGYQLGGHAGALVATLGIFLPAFAGVALTAPLVHRLRTSPVLSRALDAVNAVSLALMASAVLLIGRGIAPSPAALAILIGASVLLLYTRVGAAWVLLGGAVTGLLRLLLAAS
ncbi:chromate transporter [Gemmatimonas phototrophica]|uniref:Chromate transporter n=2 Tax=Gemmatimonas phototrophica TaxID=1379270 RepID=A0A143BKN8_9BACT|nr:chromate transporter [Gemmatimonas phototrophica]